MLSYKSSLEEKPHDTLDLMMEIKDKQPVTNDIVAIDVCEEKLSSYQHFTPVCFTLITEIKNDCFLLNTINLDQSPSPQSGAFPFACPLPLPSVFSLLQELQDWSLWKVGVQILRTIILNEYKTPPRCICPFNLLQYHSEKSNMNIW